MTNDHIDSTTTNKQLLAACWTWAGDAAPLRGDESSPLDLSRRVEAVAKAGWSGVGLIHADLRTIKSTFGYDGFRKLLQDNGIEHIELEFLADWWKQGEPREISNNWRRILLDASEHLGVSTMKVGAELSTTASPVPSVDEDAFLYEFDRLATQAGNIGTRIALEPMPMNNLGTVHAGAEFVRKVDNPHGGLTVDTWHVARSGTSYEELAEILPMDKVFVVEIDDAHADIRGANLWEDTINERLNPGEGELDTAGFVEAMHRAGWRGHWGVEILSETHRRTPVEEAVQQSHDAAMTVLNEADRRLRTTDGTLDLPVQK